MTNLFKARIRVLLLILAVLVTGAAVVSFRPHAPSVPMTASLKFLPAGSRIIGPRPSLFERRIPMSWGWLWRMREGLRGPQPSVLIDCRLIDLARIPDASLRTLVRGAPLAQTNGVQAWVLPVSALTEWGQDVEKTREAAIIAHPRVQTSHAVGCTLSVGGASPPGAGSSTVSFEVLPMIHSDGLELTTRLTVTGAITNPLSGIQIAGPSGLPKRGGLTILATNLDTALKSELPMGTGLFLMGTAGSMESRRLGVIVCPTVWRPRR